MTVINLPEVSKSATVHIALRSECVRMLRGGAFSDIRGILQRLHRKISTRGHPGYKKCGKPISRPKHSPGVIAQLIALPILLAIWEVLVASSPRNPPLLSALEASSFDPLGIAL